jgi:hypothetical protein
MKSDVSLSTWDPTDGSMETIQLPNYWDHESFLRVLHYFYIGMILKSILMWYTKVAICPKIYHISLKIYHISFKISYIIQNISLFSIIIQLINIQRGNYYYEREFIINFWNCFWIFIRWFNEIVWYISIISCILWGSPKANDKKI